MTDFGLMNPKYIGGYNAAIGLILFQSTVLCLFEAAAIDYQTPTKPHTRQSLTCDFTPVHVGFAPKPTAMSIGILPDFTGRCWINLVSSK